MQSELENLAFMYTNAEDYARVQRRIAELYKEHEKELEEVPIPHPSEIKLLRKPLSSHYPRCDMPLLLIS